MNFALDSNNDIILTGRTMKRITGTEYSAQTAKTNLHFQEGEWIVDRSEGIPWLSGALEKGTPLPLVAQLVRATVERTVGVLSVDTIEYDYNPRERQLNITFSATTIYGKTFVGAIN